MGSKRMTAKNLAEELRKRLAHMWAAALFGVVQHAVAINLNVGTQPMTFIN